jgi:sRNA-binding carbon storage regulator CsrA
MLVLSRRIGEEVVIDQCIRVVVKGVPSFPRRGTG